MKQAEEIYGFSVDELHSVELVGGAYRMPLVQSTLGNFFKPLGIKVQASLNGDEAAALGATYYAAALQGYNVRAFNLNDVLGSSLEMATDGAEPFEIFGRSSVVPSTRMIQLPKDAGEEVRITDPITGHSWTGSFDLGLASTVSRSISRFSLIFQC